MPAKQPAAGHRGDCTDRLRPPRGAPAVVTALGGGRRGGPPPGGERRSSAESEARKHLCGARASRMPAKQPAAGHRGDCTDRLRPPRGAPAVVTAVGGRRRAVLPVVIGVALVALALLAPLW